ncbi:DUF1993 domain-containing protein [Caulobacter segnis]|uniref:DUF1993 domain-containing protein n=3 Tax=Caulobacter segnis TaxID=88688 RepID=D5VMP1_CAUST|nr:Domain of unknown function DUF1993 [Caulobacter segnis ATCC 21756]AVQ04510.1 DUF1993 domain-containing protein [Caulobacter segnis]
MDPYTLAIPTYVQMLRGLSAQLSKGEAFAADNGLSTDDLLTARLAPDMFPLSTQVRFVCTQASDLLRHLTGADSFAPAEDAADFEGLRAQLADAVARLEATPASAFDGAAQRKVELKLPNGVVFDMTGEQFVRDWAFAQFYFHATTAYAILRHKGVPLGKPDWVSHMFAYIRPGTFPGG